MGAAAAPIAAVSSIASIGLKAGGDVMEGRAKQEEYETKAQNAILESRIRAENYRQDAYIKSENSLYEGKATQQKYQLEASSDEMKAGQADRAVEFGKVQATLTGASFADDLNRTLGQIEVMRAAANTDPMSPTGAAVAGAQRDKSDLARKAAMVSQYGQIAEDEAGAKYLRDAAKFALFQGDTARAFGEKNAATVLEFGEKNAKMVTEYGDINAQRAREAGSAAAKAGKLKAITGVVSGIGKMAGGMG